MVLGKIFLTLATVMFISGCATSKQAVNAEQLQLRVGELERELAEREDEIADLQDELDHATSQARRREEITEEVLATTSKKKSDVIRVGASVGQVQIALKKAGYYSGAIDSKLGDGTKKAIVQFQQDNSLKADGVIGRQTWDKLKTYLE